MISRTRLNLKGKRGTIRSDAPQAEASEIDPRRLPAVQAAQAPGVLPAPARQALGSRQATRGRRASAALLLCGSLGLAACATRSPEVGLTEVAVSCVAPETPRAPEVHSTDQLAKVPDGPTLFVMTASDYEKLYAWMLQASPALEGCRAAGPAKDGPAGPLTRSGRNPK